MVQFGIITERIAATCKCRVKSLTDGIVSMPIPVIVTGAVSNKHYHLPDEGEQVAVLMDERWEMGVILGAIYSTEDTPPTDAGEDVECVEFSDGTVIKYNRLTSTLTVVCDGEVNIECTTANITGAVDIVGNVEITGTVTATGNIISQADVKAGAGGLITLLTHKHPTAATGAPSTPIP